MTRQCGFRTIVGLAAATVATLIAGGFAWWLAAGVVAVAGGVVLLAFRLRRRRPTFDEQELERLVGEEPQSEREEREWDPVP